MATKTISITEDAYERLARQKNALESFSDVILRITKRAKLSDFAGVLSAASAQKLEQRMKKARARSRVRAAHVRQLVRQ
jgi:predicted CopG family antitoxin